MPLEAGGYGVGVVARAAPKGKILLAYLFGPKRIAVPSLAQVEGLKPKDAALKIMVGDLGLIRGSWPIIGRSDSWQRSEWPIPVFVMREPLGRRRAWLVYYADDDPSRRVGMELAPPETTGMESDSCYGFRAAEVVLTQVLTQGRGGVS